MNLDARLAAGTPPIMAILRGLTPVDAPTIGAALVEAGIRLIEVPLNSPEPFESIELLQRSFGDVASVGAGTVLTVGDVDRLAATGATLMVTPNTDASVISQGVLRGLEVMPGFLSASEAFVAIHAGARRLKLFPASALNPAYLRALREVLPRAVALWAVGGTSASNLSAWLDAGAEGIGVGSALYKPGDSAEVVGVRARELVTAWRQHGARPMP